MSLGWIKIHRDLTNWEWYKTPNMVQLFVHLLLRANHSPNKWQGIDIASGQFVSGRKALSQETGLSEQVIRTCLLRFKSTNELTIKTTTKYSLFTLNNWNKYQIDKPINQQPNQPITNEQPTTNQQLTTNKNDKNVNNEKETITPPKNESILLRNHQFSVRINLQNISLIGIRKN